MLNEAGSGEVTHNSWDASVGTTSMYHRICDSGFALSAWGASPARDFSRCVTEAKERMACYSGKHDAFSLVEFETTKRRYLHLLHQKEVYWKQ